MTTEQSITLTDLTPEQLKQLNGELRAYADNVAQENKKLRGRVLESDLRAIGLSHEEGLGIAVVDNYDGDLTREALTDWVKDKYRYTPPVTEEVVEERAAEVETATAAAQELESTIGGVGQSLEPAGEEGAFQSIVNRMNDPEAGTAEAQQSVAAKLRALNQESQQ